MQTLWAGISAQKCCPLCRTSVLRFLHSVSAQERCSGNPGKKRLIFFPGSFFLEICPHKRRKKIHFFPNLCMSYEDNSVDCDFADFVETFQCPRCHCTLAILVPDSVQELQECPQSMECAQPASSPASGHRAASHAGLSRTPPAAKH